ncbi:MAG: hypothetical protein R3F49_17370 [Planctomycetota bacterium]
MADSRVMNIALRCRLVDTAGALLVVAGIAHAFGFAQFDAGLAEVAPDTRGGLHAGWLWGSVTFVALGAITLGASRRWRRAIDPRPTVLPTAIALLVFGGVGFVARGLDPHFLGFVVLGLLVGVPVVGAASDG